MTNHNEQNERNAALAAALKACTGAREVTVREEAAQAAAPQEWREAALVVAMTEAHAAGKAWAENLKVGDRFLGARPEAESRYQEPAAIRMFWNAALDVFDRAECIMTGMDGRLIEYRLRAAQEAR